MIRDAGPAAKLALEWEKSGSELGAKDGRGVASHEKRMVVSKGNVDASQATARGVLKVGGMSVFRTLQTLQEAVFFCEMFAESLRNG